MTPNHTTYSIVATTTTTYHDDGWTATRQVPTFVLDANQLGIVSADHAARIAGYILGVTDNPHHTITAAVSVGDNAGTYYLDRTVTASDLGRKVTA